MITVTVAKTDADAGILHEELLGALGAIYTGCNVTPTQVQVFLTDAATGADEDEAEQVVGDHPVAESSTAGDLAAAISAAQTALRAEDFGALRTALNACVTVADLKAVLVDVLRDVYYAAAVQGLTTDDPGA